MTQQEKRTNALKKMRNMRLSMIIGYGIIVIAAIIGVTLFAVNENESVLKNKVTSMTSTLNVQLQLNLDSYLSRMETTGTLAFAVDNAYTFDASDETNDEYEAINTEKAISEKLNEICLMENFVDYGIVYRNNSTVGKISNGTTKLFGNNLYSDLSGMISRKRTRDGWYTGYQDDYERVYYVKQIHDNAILAISFYTTELEKVFDNPEAMSDMTIRLTDRNDRIIYSSEKGELGTALPSDISAQLSGRLNATVLNDTYLTTVNTSEVDWRIICTIPTDIILKEKNEMQRYIYLAAAIAALLAVIVGAVFTALLSDPARAVAASLDSGTFDEEYNELSARASFMDKAEELISADDGKTYAFVLVDIDNYRDIVFNLGREASERAMEKLINCVNTSFPRAALYGRIATDTIGVLTELASNDRNVYNKVISRKCTELCAAFRASTKSDDGEEIKISASVGVAVSPERGKTVQEIYECANTALYISKTSGKDSYSIY